VPPERIEVALGVAEIVKSGVVTLSVTLALCASSSVPVPVIVRFAFPPGVFADVVIVSVALPDVVIEEGANDAEAPAGMPVAAKLTVSVNP
jgi:hypothetical protein